MERLDCPLWQHRLRPDSCGQGHVPPPPDCSHPEGRPGGRFSGQSGSHFPTRVTRLLSARGPLLCRNALCELGDFVFVVSCESVTRDVTFPLTAAQTCGLELTEAALPVLPVPPVLRAHPEPRAQPGPERPLPESEGSVGARSRGWGFLGTCGGVLAASPPLTEEEGCVRRARGNGQRHRLDSLRTEHVHGKRWEEGVCVRDTQGDPFERERLSLQTGQCERLPCGRVL